MFFLLYSFDFLVEPIAKILLGVQTERFGYTPISYHRANLCDFRNTNGFVAEAAASSAQRFFPQ